MFINVTTLEYPLTMQQIIAAHPNVSFPNPFQPSDEYATVQTTALPAFDAATHKCVEAAPEQANGVWSQVWVVLLLTQSDLNDNAAAAAQGLIDARAAKNLEINASRLAANRSPFACAGKLFACDELSRSDIDGINGYVTLFGGLPAAWPGGWKAIDNSVLVIPDLNGWKAFYGSMVVAGNTNFVKAQTLKASLALAATLSQIAAISW